MTNIQVEDLSAIKKRVTFEIPEDRVADMLDAEYRELKKTVQVKGFRKGKAPLNIIRGYFRSKVEADTARKIVEETFEPGLSEQKLSPVAVLSIDQDTVQEGKPFTYTAEIEVPPPVELKAYRGLKLTKTVREVTEDQVNERLQKLRERLASLDPIPETRGAMAGDHLVVDISVEAEGQTVSVLTVTDYHMELGRNFYLPDFDTHLYGMKPDERKQITVTLPEDFARKDLAGKSATFDVMVKEAKVRTLPELDDDFAKDLGELDSLDALKESIRKDLTRMIGSETTRELRNQIIDQLIELNPLDVPDSMVEGQIDRMLEDSYRNLALQGIDPNRLPPPTPEQREQLRPTAIRSVKGSLILAEIEKREGIEISEEELQAGLTTRAEVLQVSPDHLKDQMERNNVWEDFRHSLSQEKTYELIEEHAEITERRTAEKHESEDERSEKE